MVDRWGWFGHTFRRAQPPPGFQPGARRPYFCPVPHSARAAAALPARKLRDGVGTNAAQATQRPRCGTVLARVLNTRWLHLDQPRLNTLVEACTTHSGGGLARDVTVATCHDADRLDLARLGIEPRCELLATRHARQQRFYEWAVSLATRARQTNPCLGSVYHVSEIGGIRLFKPRLYWYVPGTGKSGPYRGQRIIGGELRNCVYASSYLRMAFYYPPRGIGRLCMLYEKNSHCVDIPNPGRIVYPRWAMKRLRDHRFFVYRFSLERFTRLANGEYVAFESVRPESIVELRDVVTASRQLGFEVAFSSDLVAVLRNCLARGVVADSEGVPRVR